MESIPLCVCVCVLRGGVERFLIQRDRSEESHVISKRARLFNLKIYLFESQNCRAGETKRNLSIC